MAIPKYNEMYRPFLDCLQDGQSHSFKAVKESVALAIGVAAEERGALLPSGKQAIYDNRIGWTRTYLKKAGLLESPTRGVFVLTEEGRKVLAENPVLINDDYLRKYESFRAFKNPIDSLELTTVITAIDDTPQDVFDSAYLQINASLEDELITEIWKQSPLFFEKLVVQLLEKMGYGGSLAGAGTVTKQSGDEGIDGIIREDKLGFNLIYIQAKKWELDKKIGRPEIQKFVGALAGQGAVKGLFISTSQFTKESYAYAERQHTTKVILVDGSQLTKLMVEYGLGVHTQAIYEIKQIDADFFNGEDI